MRILKTYFPVKENVLIVGGLHGDELTPFTLLENVFKAGEERRNPNVTIIPFVNIDGLKSRTHNDPFFNQDINRMFFNDSTLFEKYPQLKKEIESADLVIDLHTHLYTKTLPYGVMFKKDKVHKDLITNLGLKYVEYGDKKKEGSRIENTLVNYVNSLGKKGIIIEMSNLEDLNSENLKVIENKILSFLLGKSISTQAKSLYIQKSTLDVIITENLKQIGDLIKKDEVVLKGFDINSLEDVEIKSEHSGYLVTQPKKVLMKKEYSLLKISN